MISYPLDELAGSLLYFKCENLQLSGSFKIRGATNAVFSLSEAEAARGVVTHSSGNHGAALALAAQMRGIRAWVVMPRNAPQVKVRAVEAYKARIFPFADTDACTRAKLPPRNYCAPRAERSCIRMTMTVWIAGRRHGGAGISRSEIPDLRYYFAAPVSGGVRTAFRHGHRGQIASPGNSGHRLRTSQRRRCRALLCVRADRAQLHQVHHCRRPARHPFAAHVQGGSCASASIKSCWPPKMKSCKPCT